MQRLVLVFALVASLTLVGSIADAASPRGASPPVAESERARPCEKRVEGILRKIYDREDMSCRAAKRVMTRWLLHRHLASKWQCQGNAFGSFGRCLDRNNIPAGFSWKSPRG
jgi:hypothetical protein